MTLKRFKVWLRGLRPPLEHVVIDDAIWARACRDGDRDALAELDRALDGVLTRICRSVLRDHTLADAARNHTLTVVWKKRAAVWAAGSRVGWVSFVAWRVSCSLLRKELRAAGRVRLLGEWDVLLPEPPASDLGLQAVEVLAHLPEKFLAPCMMRFVEEKSFKNIAAELGRTESAVKSQVSRGVDKLRERFGEATAVALTALSAAGASAGPATLGGTAKAVTASVLLAVGVGAGLCWYEMPAVPTPATAARPAAKPESYQDATARVFRQVVLPKVRDALTPAVSGGEVVLIDPPDAYDTRLTVRFALRHRPPDGKPFESELNFTFDTYTRNVRAGFALVRGGPGREVDPAQPIVLVRGLWGGRDVTLSSEPLRQAVAAFADFPCDPRAGDEWQKRVRAVRAAFEPYLGVWCVRGDPAAECRIAWDEPSGNCDFWTPGRPKQTWLFADCRLDGRRPLRLKCNERELTLSADRSRLFVGGGEWWSRPSSARP